MQSLESMKNLLFILFIIPSILHAQKHDSNWLIGGDCITGNEDFILTQLDFSDQNFRPKRTAHFPYAKLETNSVMSDSQGNLLFYTNGNTIQNWKHEPMKNGEYLIEEGCDWENLQQGAISIPSPYLQNQYVLCLLYTSPSPRDQRGSRMPSSA